MTEAEILNGVAQAFSNELLDVGSPLETALPLEDVDGLDSVSRVQLMLGVEEIFGIEISQKENSELQTIGDLVDLVRRKVGK